MKTKTYDLNDSCISHAAIDTTLENVVDLADMYSKIQTFMCELDAKRAYVGGGGLSYKDRLLFEDAFKKGFAAAHMINHRRLNE